MLEPTPWNIGNWVSTPFGNVLIVGMQLGETDPDGFTWITIQCTHEWDHAELLKRTSAGQIKLRYPDPRGIVDG